LRYKVNQPYALTYSTIIDIYPSFEGTKTVFYPLFTAESLSVESEYSLLAEVYSVLLDWLDLFHFLRSNPA